MSSVKTLGYRRQRRRPSGSTEGFTLMEVLIAVLIIGVLLSIAIPSFVKAREDTITTRCLENMRVIFHAAHVYEIETGKPLVAGTNGVTLRNTLLSGGYVTKRTIFECPVSGVRDYDDYQLIYSLDKLRGIRCTLLPSDHILP